MQTDERIQILEHALFESNEGLENSKTIVSPNWLQLISPGAKHSSTNAVFRSILTDDELKKQIEQVKALYQSLGLKFRWYVTPSTQPKNTDEVLQKNGFTLYYEAEALITETEKAILPYSNDFEVREIKKDSMQDYIGTFAEAWKITLEQKEELERQLTHGFDKEPNLHVFVAYENQQPVATSLLISLSMGGYLAGGAVKEEFRGRGIYRAMISARAKLAQMLGHKYLIMHAKKATSAPICRMLGFEWIFDYKVFEPGNQA